MAQDEATLVAYATEMFHNHRVSQPTFQKALDQFGARSLTEISTMMDYYTLLVYNASSIEIDLPEGGPEPVFPV